MDAITELFNLIPDSSLDKQKPRMDSRIKLIGPLNFNDYGLILKTFFHP